jgi:peptidyl-Lys metalloendopeptidase
MAHLAGMKKWLGVTALVAIAVLCGVQAASAAPQGMSAMSVRIETEKAFLGETDGALVRVTLSNGGAQDLYLLHWQTAVRGVQGDIFDVRLNGKPVPYVGRLYKWAKPQAEDYVRVPAGNSVSAEVDLTAYYDMSGTGEYTVRYRTAVQDALSGVGTKIGAAGAVAIESNELSLGVERGEQGRLLQAFRQADFGAKALTPGFVSCTSTRQTALTTALGNAEVISLKARDYLNNVPTANRPTDTAYKTWFGAYLASRYSTVQSHYTAIHSAFATKTVEFYCDCTDSAYAYVYSNQPYKIHLCNAFWNAPNLGIDSKAGTLVHEMSHFSVVAGTSDYAYGTSACQRLATSNPKKAVNNADSHEYFAETR